MSVPFYVSPEQVVKDKADYARKGIARGRSVVVVQYVDGILLVAENTSRALHKISEIYDSIAFAAVGKYNEFENLRVAGVRLADLRGYSYDRNDVTGRGLANFYAQTLGTIFTETNKPYEVEIVVAEVGADAEADQMYRLTYDGSVGDEHGFVAMGGSAEQVANSVRERYREQLTLADALNAAVTALGQDGAEPRRLASSQLEVAVLDRTRPRRKFRRLSVQQLDRLLTAQAGPAGPTADGGPGSETGPDADTSADTSTDTSADPGPGSEPGPDAPRG